MKDPAQSTVLVVDHGIFFGFAQLLAKSFKRVLYHNPVWERGFPSCRDGSIGDGFGQPELCDDFWPIKGEINCAIFPDIGQSGLQLELESQGIPVWGSRGGDKIELNRKFFLQCLEDVGLEVPEYTPIKGLTNLRAYLAQNENQFVKISKWRGDLETFHHINIKLSRAKLDLLAMQFGTLQDEIPFLVFEPIETDLEVGYDGYSVDGWYPNTAVHGIEKKDEGYFGAVQDYDDLPEQVKEVNEKMSPILERFRYRNFFSTEIRIKGDKFYLIDPCCRMGMPSGDAQTILYKNLPQIILAGVEGEVVEPEFENKFVAQVLIKHKDKDCNWRDIQIPDDVAEFVRLLSPVQIRDTIGISPSSASDDVIGSVLGVGKTIEETIEHLKANAEKLEDNAITVHTEVLMDVLKEMHAAEKAGIEMTPDAIPSPTSIVDA